MGGTQPSPRRRTTDATPAACLEAGALGTRGDSVVQSSASAQQGTWGRSSWGLRGGPASTSPTAPPLRSIRVAQDEGRLRGRLAFSRCAGPRGPAAAAAVLRLFTLLPVSFCFISGGQGVMARAWGQGQELGGPGLATVGRRPAGIPAADGRAWGTPGHQDSLRGTRTRPQPQAV